MDESGEFSGKLYTPCDHLLEFKRRNGLQPFTAVQSCLVVGAGRRASLRRDPGEVAKCFSCGKSQGRLYACLTCAIIGCYNSFKGHISSHALSSPSHELAVDIERVELFCSICNDQVYDQDFDQAVLSHLVAARYVDNAALALADDAETRKGEASGILRKSLYESDISPLMLSKSTWIRKRKRGAEYRAWVPSAQEQLALNEGTIPLLSDTSLPLGLRGLNNLGSTCFMNSVLQALLHTPPLRNYFLSDKHNRRACQRRVSHLCLGCDMDDIFAAAFSGNRSPYSPAQFLYSWWRHAENLAGYEQQDAHEFFISTVDGIHANSGLMSPRARMSRSGRDGDVDCRCIVHKVFSGVLRSDVTCSMCGFTSTTYDPCVDVSLDLEPDKAPPSTPLTASQSTGATNGIAATGAFSHANCLDPSTPPGELQRENGCSEEEGGAGEAVATLAGCLDRFTRQERLGSNEKFFCQQCQLRQESIKQMSVRKLPLVLCFHIKRFEHSSTRKTSRKVDRYVQFPFALNMAPYLSSTVVQLRNGNRMVPEVPPEPGTDSDSHASCQSSEVPQVAGSLSKYELFAVVTHAGKLDSGHYVSFLRLDGEWYKCDDAWVVRVNEDVVRSSQVYMLYYVQKVFLYKAADESLSHVAEGVGGTDGPESSGIGLGMPDVPTVSSSQVNGA